MFTAFPCRSHLDLSVDFHFLEVSDDVLSHGHGYFKDVKNRILEQNNNDKYMLRMLVSQEVMVEKYASLG